MECTTQTITITETVSQQEAPVIHMTLKPKNHVQWTEDTVDNEFLNKRKSKICCKYEKPKTHPDDTSSCSSDSDAGNNYDKYPRHQRKAMCAKKC